MLSSLFIITASADAISIIAPGSDIVFIGDPVLIKEPTCTGSEEHLFDCSISEFRDFLCDFHLTDAAVFCSGNL